MRIGSASYCIVDYPLEMVGTVINERCYLYYHYLQDTNYNEITIHRKVHRSACEHTRSCVVTAYNTVF
jgi:hypothetical protein